jgi:uncharacterized membrane protein YdjX (TVP38/TMEM64 family)
MDRKAETQPLGQAPASLQWRRALPPVIILSAMAAGYLLGLHRHLSLQSVSENREAIAAFTAHNWALALLAFVAVYVAAVALSLPGAVALTVLGGLLFGWVVSGLAVLFSATLGAVIIFSVVRTAFGGVLVRRAGPVVARVSEGFAREAFSYLLFLRLVPVFPFWLVNIAAAVANVPLRTFVTATFFGIMPATFTFAYLGEGLDGILKAQSASHAACVATNGARACPFELTLSSLLTTELLLAFLALGVLALLPVLVKRLRGRT